MASGLGRGVDTLMLTDLVISEVAVKMSFLIALSVFGFFLPATIKELGKELASLMLLPFCSQLYLDVLKDSHGV